MKWVWTRVHEGVHDLFRAAGPSAVHDLRTGLATAAREPAGQEADRAAYAHAMRPEPRQPPQAAPAACGLRPVAVGGPKPARGLWRVAVPDGIPHSHTIGDLEKNLVLLEWPCWQFGQTERRVRELEIQVTRERARPESSWRMQPQRSSSTALLRRGGLRHLP